MSANNKFFSLQKGFLALMSAALLFSCSQIEPFEMEDMNVLRSSGMVENTLLNCNEHCISDDNPDTYQKLEGKDAITWGGQNQHTKTINYVAYNTETHFFIEVGFQRQSPGSGTHSGNVNVKFEGNEEYKTISNGASEIFSFPLPTNWVACQNVDFDIFENSDDKIISISQSYNLYGICADCEDSFSYASNEDGTYTFTYVSEESIDDAHLVFTFPQGVVVKGLGSWESNGNTKQLNTAIESCTKYTWTVGLSTECNGQGQKSANLWTDFKVNDISLKGDLSNITQTCN